MAPQRAADALNAMKVLGFPTHRSKPVLKKLLKVYENNWECIEGDNYSVLADALLDWEEPKEEEDPKRKRNDDDSEPYRRELRAKQEEQQRPSSSIPKSGMNGDASLKSLKIEADGSPQQQRRLGRVENGSPGPSVREKSNVLTSLQTPLNGGPVAQTNRSILAHQMGSDQEEAEAITLVRNRKDKRPVDGGTQNMICYKEPKTEPGIEVPSKNVVTFCYNDIAMPKEEPCDSDSPTFEVPIAMICPPQPMSERVGAHQHRGGQDDSSTQNDSAWQANDSGNLEAQHVHRRKGKESNPDAACKKRPICELVRAQETSSTNIEIASSSSGEVKLLFTCSSIALDRPDFRMPSLEAVLKTVEDRCLMSYKILQPSFSLVNLMKEMCQCVWESGSESTEDQQENTVKQTPELELMKKDQQENFIKLTPALESLKKPDLRYISGGMLVHSSNGLPNLTVPQIPGMAMNGLRHSMQINEKLHEQSENERSKKKKESRVPKPSNIMSQSLVVVQQPQLALGDLRPLHDVNDISKGEERVRISSINEVSSQQYPPSFYYIPHNIVHQNAYLSFSLARIGDEDCCSDCFGDCLAASIPCACARETGGEYAYTMDGLIKKEFLNSCISMNRNPQKHHHFYCKDCPLERTKNGSRTDQCKGHLVRKFVKECWSKCGCNKQCGNRVVQRGITCNLQVFCTSEGKGWGLRTLDELPRGAFVCEYVGEVLTNMELYYRTIQTTGNARHTYPVLLDADWGSEGILKDEEALCLDATFYGNVARFINHRCSDANLVEIPVEVETPDHHYYHLAFFTTRRVEAFEELTWDYGINFEDHTHPVKAFRCRCGSKICRDRKRPTKSRAGALVLR